MHEEVHIKFSTIIANITDAIIQNISTPFMISDINLRFASENASVVDSTGII
jgi:hypothetical protein